MLSDRARLVGEVPERSNGAVSKFAVACPCLYRLVSKRNLHQLLNRRHRMPAPRLVPKRISTFGSKLGSETALALSDANALGQQRCGGFVNS